MNVQESRLRLSVDSRGARTNVRRLNKDLRDVTVSGRLAAAESRALSRAFKGVAAAAAGFASINGIRSLVGDLQVLQGINSRLSGLTGDLAGQQRFLRESTAATSAEYVTLADGYSKLLPLYDAQVLSIERVRQLTLGLADAQAATGATNAELGLAIRGASQALAAGIVNYEDYKQIVEPLPGLNNRIAASFGLTSGELKALISTGQLTSEEFGGRLVAAFEGYSGAAARLSENITQTFNRTRNEYTKAVEAFEQPISFAAVESAELLADALRVIGNNAEEIIEVGQIAGTVLALAFGGRAAAGVLQFLQSQRAALSSVNSFAVAQAKQAASNVAEIGLKVDLARVTNSYAAAELKAAQAKAASITGFKRLSFVAGELAVAERAAATAATQLAAAENSAALAAGRLTAAQRAATVSAAAFATAQRAASGALALVGGPAGAVALAAGGLAFLALRQTDAEKTAERLSEAIGGLEAAYFRNAEAARANAQATEDSIASDIKAVESTIARLSVLSDFNVFERIFNSFVVTNSVEELEVLRQKLVEIQGETDRLETVFTNDAAFSFPDSIRDGLAQAAEATRVEAENLRKSIDDLFPDDKKIKELEDLQGRINAAFRGNEDDELFKKASAEIREQINDLNGFTEAQEAAADEAEKLRSALESALPETARIREFEEQYDLLAQGLAMGGDNAFQYARAIEALSAEFDREGAAIATERYEALNDVLRTRIDSPYEEYRQDIQLLNQALLDTPEKADQIRLALANIDARISVDFVVVEGDTQAKVEENFARQLEALNQFHRERQVSEEQAKANLAALEQSAGRQIEDIQRETRDRLLAFGNVSAGVQFDLDVSDTESDLQRLLDDRIITQEQYQIAAQAAALAHQEQLSQIVRDGGATQAQLEGANFQERLAGFIAQNQQVIDASTSLVDSLLGLRADAEAARAQRTLTGAQDDARAAQEAQALFEQTGSDQNRIAAEQARERARISEIAARKAFEDQKKAQIQQARISQALAIVNAFTTGGNFITGGIAAAAAAAATERQIQQIKRTQFNGGSSSLATGGGSGGSSAGTSNNNQNVSQPGENAQPQVTFVLLGGPEFVNEQEQERLMAQRFRNLADNNIIGQNENMSFNFENVPAGNVRRVTA